MLLPGAWANLGISLLFDGEIMNWVLSGLAALVTSVLIALFFWFEIRVDRSEVVIKLLFGPIPFKTIKSATNDLIIDHRDVEGLTLISHRKDFYSEDVKNNLRFDYIIPWDGDNYELYIDYKNKELDLTICCHDELWIKIIEGLKLLNNTADKYDHI
ncbi:MAG: hypothetical protein WBA74_25345 [Cyclobacteriaceae bacterium]